MSELAQEVRELAEVCEVKLEPWQERFVEAVLSGEELVLVHPYRGRAQINELFRTALEELARQR